MFSVDDTIVAIATPIGRGGLGVVRISGPDAARVAACLLGRSDPLAPRHATFATLVPAPSATRTAATSVPPGDLRPSGDCRPSGRPPSPAAGGAPPPSPVPEVPAVARVADAVSRRRPDLRPQGERGGDLRPSRQPPSLAVRDQVVATLFPAPHSYTGDDVVEISAHGSPVVLRSIVTSALDAGARLAEPGEFTLRAFLNGKLDLVQAEAVADLINAVTPLQARAAFDQLEGTLTTAIGEIEGTLFDLMARLEASLDFPDEGYHFVQRGAAAGEIEALAARIDALLASASRGRLIREGAQIAIVGTPNAGKSSLFNALLNANRAIVTPVPGTTRDLLTERADIGGIATSLVDTAGIRDSSDVIEQEGVSRARQATLVADLTVLVLDRSRPLGDDDLALIEVTAARPRIVAINKIDLPAAWTRDWIAELQPLELSVKEGEGLAELVAAMSSVLTGSIEDRDQPLVTNVRHIALLDDARAALSRAVDALAASGHEISEEFVLADLQAASSRLQEITGRRTTEDLLAHIFGNFCIGK